MTMQASGLIKFSDIMSEIDSDEEPFRLGHANNGIYDLSLGSDFEQVITNNTSSYKDANQIIVSLFSEHSPRKRQEILRDIDNKIIKLLDLSEDDLPWLSSTDKFDEKWSKIMDDLRLVVSKFKYEQLQDERSVN